jgi:hypothetical protein
LYLVHERRCRLRRLLFAAAAVVVICAVVAAGEKLSRQARQKIAGIKAQLKQRVGREPLSFKELCWVEVTRLEKRDDEEEIDPLKSLYALRYGLRKGIAKLNPYWRPKEEPEEEYEYVRREYDVTDIVTQAPDRPAPTIGFGRGPFLRGTTTRTEVKPRGGAG